MFLLSPFVLVTASSSNCKPSLTFYDLFPLLLSVLSASITESLCLLSYGGDFLNQLHMPLLLWFTSHQQLVPACSSGAAPGMPVIAAYSYLSSPQNLSCQMVAQSGTSNTDLTSMMERILSRFNYVHLLDVLNAWCTFVLHASCRAHHQPTILNEWSVQSCFLSPHD